MRMALPAGRGGNRPRLACALSWMGISSGDSWKGLVSSMPRMAFGWLASAPAEVGDAGLVWVLAISGLQQGGHGFGQQVEGRLGGLLRRCDRRRQGLLAGREHGQGLLHALRGR